jgi:hypothetical protein
MGVFTIPFCATSQPIRTEFAILFSVTSWPIRAGITANQRMDYNCRELIFITTYFVPEPVQPIRTEFTIFSVTSKPIRAEFI